MKRKIAILAVSILAFSLLLNACGQKNISEEKAEEIAINAINNAFDADIAQMSVILMQHQEIAYENDEIVQKDHDPLVEYYRLDVTAENGGTPYYAEVDPKTGALEYLTRSVELITLTQEQHDLAASIGSFEQFSPDLFSKTQKDAANVAVKWVQEKFEPQGTLDHATTKDVYTDREMFPTVIMDSIVVMQSGSVYHVFVCWPVMEVVQVQIFHQEF
jgi:hypothetical protein